MKLPLICTLLLAGLTTTSSLAGPLPTLKEKGWTSFHAGFVGSGFEAGVDAKGQIALYFTPKKKERLNTSWPVEVKFRIERRTKGKEKWSYRKTQQDGFTSTGNVEFKQEKMEYVATATGDVKYKVTVKFNKSGMEISGEMVGKPKDADKAEYRLVLRSAMPSVMLGSSKYNEKELKSKTRGDEVRLEFKEEKGQKIRLYEVTDANKINAIFPKSIMLKADKIGRKDLIWSMLDPKDKGALELEFKSSSNRFLDGFNITAILVDEKGEQVSKGIKLDYD